MYKSKRGFNTPSQDDVHDALTYYVEEYNYVPSHITSISKLKHAWAFDLQDLGSWPAEPRGWLLDIPKSEWANELQSAYSRDFEHIIAAYNRKELRPAIVINDHFSDGRGRSMFLDGIGEMVPYVELKVK